MEVQQSLPRSLGNYIFSWFEPICEANKKVKMVNYKICYITKRKNKLLVQ